MLNFDFYNPTRILFGKQQGVKQLNIEGKESKHE
jgi:alcohol dehydrogenase YqhD (iron-dependent ADH family)